MTVTLEQFSSLIGDIYQSAREPELWQKTFVKTVSVLDSASDGIAVNLISEDGEISWLYCRPAQGDARFDFDERSRLLHLLAPHFQQALHIQFQLMELGDQRDDLLGLLQYAKHGVVLTTHCAKVMFANEVATDILARCEGIEVREGELHSLRVAEQSTLKRFIDTAGRGNAEGIRTGGSLGLRRASGGRDFALHILPLGQEHSDERPLRASVLILIVNPDFDPEPQVETLKRLYGLTKTEAAVAIRVTRGEGLQAVADNLGVSLSTVRIHLQRVFEKTDTHRQAELVRLLLTVQAGIRMPEG